MRITTRGDCLLHTSDAGLLAANLLKMDVLINNIIFNTHKRTQFMMANIKYYFLSTPMWNLEYIKLDIKHFP